MESCACSIRNNRNWQLMCHSLPATICNIDFGIGSKEYKMSSGYYGMYGHIKIRFNIENYPYIFNFLKKPDDISCVFEFYENGNKYLCHNAFFVDIYNISVEYFFVIMGFTDLNAISSAYRRPSVEQQERRP